jgi:hypothetical protein
MKISTYDVAQLWSNLRAIKEQTLRVNSGIALIAGLPVPTTERVNKELATLEKMANDCIDLLETKMKED